MLQNFFQHTIHSVCLTICLGMKCCANLHVGSEKLLQVLSECASESGVSVKHFVLRNSMRCKDPVLVELYDSWCSDSVASCNEMLKV